MEFSKINETIPHKQNFKDEIKQSNIQIEDRNNTKQIIASAKKSSKDENLSKMLSPPNNQIEQLDKSNSSKINDFFVDKIHNSSKSKTKIIQGRDNYNNVEKKFPYAFSITPPKEFGSCSGISGESQDANSNKVQEIICLHQEEEMNKRSIDKFTLSSLGNQCSHNQNRMSNFTKTKIDELRTDLKEIRTKLKDQKNLCNKLIDKKTSNSFKKDANISINSNNLTIAKTENISILYPSSQLNKKQNFKVDSFNYSILNHSIDIQHKSDLQKLSTKTNYSSRIKELRKQNIDLKTELENLKAELGQLKRFYKLNPSQKKISSQAFDLQLYYIEIPRI